MEQRIKFDKICHDVVFLESLGGLSPCLLILLQTGAAVFYDVALHDVVRTLNTPSTTTCMAVSSQKSGNQIATGSTDRCVQVWSPWTGECYHTTERTSGDVYSVGFSPDGSILAATCTHGRLYLWDTEAPTFPMKSSLIVSNPYPTNFSFSADSNFIAFADSTSDIKLYCISDDRFESVRLDTRGSAFVCKFLPATSNKIVVADKQQQDSPNVQKFTQGNFEISLFGHGSVVWTMDISQDGTMLVTGSQGARVCLWDIASGRLLRVICKHGGAVTSVRFHPNGKQVISSSYDKTVRIWTICEWSDQLNYLFKIELQRMINLLMCIKNHMQNIADFPQLPMQLWLGIFQELAVLYES
jgi:WD40 repeat protein